MGWTLPTAVRTGGGVAVLYRSQLVVGALCAFLVYRGSKEHASCPIMWVGRACGA